MAFIDVRMPPGIDGLETARKIRTLDDRIYVIIVTAYSDRSVEEIQAVLEHDVLLARKPLSRDEILQQARNACNRWQEDEALRHEGEKSRERTDQLELSRMFLMDVISAIPETVILCSPRGRIRYVNHAGVKMIGYTAVQLNDKLVDLLFPGSGIRNLLRGIVENNLKPRRVKRLLLNSRGEDRPVLVSGSALCDQAGNVRSVLLTISDFAEFEKQGQKMSPLQKVKNLPSKR